MIYNRRYCDFIWNRWGGDFNNVLIHEKTHKKTRSSMDALKTIRQRYQNEVNIIGL